MTKDKLWVLAMNSEWASILRGVNPNGTADAPELMLKTEHHDLKEIMADKPGRSFSSADGRRSAMEYASDPVREAERRFARDVVQVLDKQHRAGAFSKLAIFASPGMLGVLRPALTDGLAGAVTTEIAKNFVHESATDLLRIVSQELFAR